MLKNVFVYTGTKSFPRPPMYYDDLHYRFSLEEDGFWYYVCGRRHKENYFLMEECWDTLAAFKTPEEALAYGEMIQKYTVEEEVPFA